MKSVPSAVTPRDYRSPNRSWFMNLCECVEKWYTRWIGCLSQPFFGHVIYVFFAIEGGYHSLNSLLRALSHRYVKQLVVFSVI